MNPRCPKCGDGELSLKWDDLQDHSSFRLECGSATCGNIEEYNLDLGLSHYVEKFGEYEPPVREGGLGEGVFWLFALAAGFLVLIFIMNLIAEFTRY